MLEIIQFPDPILLQKSQQVEFPLKPEDQTLINELLKVMKSNPDHYAGLSAVQLGQLKRICVVQRYDKRTDENTKPEWLVMINPKLISKSEKMVSRWDGCLSVKDGKLFAKTLRAERVTIEYSDINGNVELKKGKGFFSHVLQHELDHLDGILFMKYVADPNDFYTEEQLEKQQQ
jgi:peptide deformylase